MTFAQQVWDATRWALPAGWLIWHTVTVLQRPRIDKADILHAERWCSGYRLTNLWTQLGNARNCLMALFLEDRIIMRLHYPFSMIAPFYGGFDLSIPYSAIIDVRDKKLFWISRGLILHYRDDSRGTDKVFFMPRRRDRVLAILHERCPKEAFLPKTVV